jgi:preprotein translocase subunit SecA
MRLFGSERIAKLMDRLGAQEGEVLTHSLITRSIEQAQKRVELQNFQSRKRLLEYDDVMNQQREVIYSLRSFALEGGEELKAEALKMIDKALAHRVDAALAEYETAAEWDIPLLQQDLLMHYLLQVPELETPDLRPTTLDAAQRVTAEAAKRAFFAKLESLDHMKDETGQGYGPRLLSLVMLNVLDEKWKDHLYDLDQLRNAIHYRSWGQKDPLIEYKQEAYSMFVDLMNDIYNTFTERFLKVQLVFDAPAGGSGAGNGAKGPATPTGAAPARRYNALGILEDVTPDVPQAAAGGNGDGQRNATDAVLDIGPEQPPKRDVVTRRDPVVVGAGRTRSVNAATQPANVDWTNVGRNDPCPCGSGKKFKKCHGVTL